MSYPIANTTRDLFATSSNQVVEITLNGLEETMIITESDILTGGLSINRYCVSGNKIEIGSVIASELNLNLDNTDGKFNNVLFEGAELFVKIGVKDGQIVHWIPMGYFTIDEAPRKLSNIALYALDRMMVFDKDVDVTKLRFPTTIGDLLHNVCDICNIVLATDDSILTNTDFVVQSCPVGDTITYRQLLAWIAEITGTCAFMDWNGHLALKWYEDTDTTITFKNRFSSDLQENSITISGVQVQNNDTIYLAGTDDYVINIESNDLIQSDYDTIAHNLSEHLRGFTYTPFSATVLPMPHVYPLDKISFVDRYGKAYDTIITSVTFALNANTTIAAKGETATKSGYASANPLTKAESTILKKLKTEQNESFNAKMQSILSINELLSNSLGMFMTPVEQKNGSVIYYMHDQSKLEESSTIFTMTSNGIAWTTNGWNDGKPLWSYGATMAGDALFRALAAERINADWITTGSIVVKNDKGKEIFYANVDTGELRMSSESINLQIGTRNYLRNGRNMIMDGYYFILPAETVHFTDKNGNYYTNAKGDRLAYSIGIEPPEPTYFTDADGNIYTDATGNKLTT